MSPTFVQHVQEPRGSPDVSSRSSRGDGGASAGGASGNAGGR